METRGVVDTHRWVLQAVERYEVRLLRFAARLLGDEDSARDTVQQVFLRLCGQSPQHLDDRVGPWLFAVCRNQVVDVLRRRKNAPASPDVEPADCCDPMPGPADTAELADLYRCMNQLVDQLPLPQREAISLWSEGFSYRDIAEMTETNEGHVRVIVHRALKQLRQHPITQRLMGAATTTP